MKKSFRILLTLVLAVVMVLSLTACISNCATGMHDFVEVPAKEATCTQAGNVAYKKCKVCNLYVDATGKKISANSVDIPAGHSYVKHSAEPASCTEAGNAEYYTCDKCNTIFDADKVAIEKLPEIPATHTFGEWVDEKPATCTETGTKGHKDCSVCNKHFDADGKELETIEIAVNPSAHTFGEWVDEKPATCQETGELGHYYCSVCEKNLADDKTTVLGSLTIDKNSNNHADLTPVSGTSATCESAGTLAHDECACGALLIDGEVVTSVVDPQKKHAYGAWDDGKVATCVATGELGHYYCSTCEKNYNAEGALIPKLTIDIDPNYHTNTTHYAEKSATCTEEGKKAHDVCNVCGAYIVDDSNVKESTLALSKLPHNYGTLVPKAPATCVDTGVDEHYRCEVCEGYFKNDESKTPTTLVALKLDIDENAHNKASAWSTTEDGKHYHACLNTGCTARFDVADHSAGTTVHHDNTHHWKTCATCSTVMEKTAHDCSTATTAPTCTEEGYDTHTCDCGYSYTDNTQNATGHNPASTWTVGTDGKHYHACNNEGCDAHLDEASHTAKATWESVADGHWKICSACGTTVVTKASHNWKSGATEPTETQHFGNECEDCGYKSQPADHSAGGDWQHETVDGIIYHYQYCGGCNYQGTKFNRGECVLDHTAAKAATCVAQGNCEYYNCDGCNTYFDSSMQVTTLAALTRPVDTTNGHKPASTWTVGTDGKHYHACQNEGCDAHLDEASHNYDQEVVYADYLKTAATCTAKAVYYKSCTCGAKGTDADTFSYTAGGYAAHTFGEWVAEKPATCSETGTKAHKDCSVCNKHFDADGKEITDLTISALGHNYGTLVATVPATCVKNGVDEHFHCDRCNGYFKNDESKTPTTLEALALVDANAHSWQTTYTQDTAPTCTTTGSESIHCSKCDETKDARDIPAAHDFGTWTAEVPATCSATGTKAHKDCSVCEKHFDAEGNLLDTIVINALGHDEQSHDAKAPTCTEVGWDAYVTCSRCSYTTYSEKQATGHDMKHHDAVPATCTEAGTVEYYACSRCNSNFSDEAGTTKLDSIVDSQKAHNLTHYEAQEATCTEEGNIEYWYCSTCKKNYDASNKEITTSVTLDKTAHTPENVPGTPASCTNSGLTDGSKCKDCGYIITPQTTIPAAHSYSYDDTSSTQHTKKCENCDIAEVQEDHDYTTGTTANTCICNKAEPEWKLVTDASTLAVGDKIIIVGIKDDAYYALSTDQKDKNRGATLITRDSDGKVTITDSVQQITLEAGTKDNTLSFNTGSGYLYAASSSGNQLKTQNNKNDDSSWTITITSDTGVATITAQGTNTRSLLQHNNSNNNNLFACYSSGQSPVYIYKLILCDHEGKATDTATTPATCTEDGKTTVTCKYCNGTISETTISAPGHDYGTPAPTDGDSTKHTYTCTREGCEHSYDAAHDYGTTHTCVCSATEPKIDITITKGENATDVTVVVKVGDEEIALVDGKYSVYQNSTVTITISNVPSGNMAAILQGATPLTASNGVVTINVTTQNIELAIGLIAEAGHAHNWGSPTPITGDDENHQVTCTTCGQTSTEVHSFGDWAQADDEKHEKTCSGCGHVVSADCSYGSDNKCSDCGREKATQKTASVTIADYAEANNWKNNSDKYLKINLDDNITVTATGGEYTGKYYTNGSSWRIYATDDPVGKIEITAKEGYKLVSVKITTAAGTYAYLKVNNNGNDICNTTVNVTGSSVTINSVKNGNSGKQVRITAIEVVYEAV